MFWFVVLLAIGASTSARPQEATETHQKLGGADIDIDIKTIAYVLWNILDENGDEEISDNEKKNFIQIFADAETQLTQLKETAKDQLKDAFLHKFGQKGDLTTAKTR